MFKDSQEENEKIKSDFRIREIDLEEKYTSEKKENEALKHRNDILFQLGENYIKLHSDKNVTKANELPGTVADAGPIRVEAVNSLESEGTGGSSGGAWLTQQMRGFRRGAVSRTPGSAGPPITVSTNEQTRTNISYSHSDSTQRGKFCHYFSNFGKCKFEDNTGRKCKFIHGGAPICRQGINCQRQKCQYKHPMPNGGPFLNGNSHSPQQMNPWGSSSPWTDQPNTWDSWAWGRPSNQTNNPPNSRR